MTGAERQARHQAKLRAGRWPVTIETAPDLPALLDAVEARYGAWARDVVERFVTNPEPLPVDSMQYAKTEADRERASITARAAAKVRAERQAAKAAAS